MCFECLQSVAPSQKKRQYAQSWNLEPVDNDNSDKVYYDNVY